MNISFKAILALSLLSSTVVLPLNATAGANHRIKRTEMRQGARIHQGVKSGELTKEERKGLRQEQHAINQDRNEAKRDDGIIDREERKELRQDQIEASKNIYKEKHDDDKN
jgi:uncharacterized membrane protein